MKLIVKLNSVTYALKANTVLQRNNIKSVVQKNPNPKKGEGCGYILTVQNAPANTLEILKDNGVVVVEAEWKK